MVNEPDVLAYGNANWISSLFSGFLAKLVLAVIILLIGFIAAKLVSRVVRRFLDEIEMDAFARKLGIERSMASLLSGVILYGSYLITILMALNQIGLTAQVLYFSSMSILILIVVSTFLGIKEFVANTMASFYVHKKYKVGQNVRTKDFSGEITKLGLTTARLETKGKETLFVPNDMLKKSKPFQAD